MFSYTTTTLCFLYCIHYFIYFTIIQYTLCKIMEVMWEVNARMFYAYNYTLYFVYNYEGGDVSSKCTYVLSIYWYGTGCVCSYAIETILPLSNFRTKHIFGILMTYKWSFKTIWGTEGGTPGGWEKSRRRRPFREWLPNVIQTSRVSSQN